MQRLMRLTTLLILSTLCSIGCKAAVQDTEETSTAVEVTSESTPTTPKDTTAANTTGGAKSPEFASKSLDVVFVGGHLGQYADCPEEGQKPKKAALFSTAKPMAERAKCAGDGCGRMNCDPGQVTIKLTNTGSEALTGVHLAPLGLIGDDKSVVATLPVSSMVNTADNERFDGTLAPNASVTLRVDFSGPTNIKDFVPSQERWGGKAPLEISVNADGQPPATITSPPVEVPGMVVT